MGIIDSLLGGGGGAEAEWMKPPRWVMQQVGKSYERQATETKRAYDIAQQDALQRLVTQGFSGGTVPETVSLGIQRDMQDALARLAEAEAATRAGLIQPIITQPSNAALTGLLGTVAQAGGQYLGMSKMTGMLQELLGTGQAGLQVAPEFLGLFGSGGGVGAAGLAEGAAMNEAIMSGFYGPGASLMGGSGSGGILSGLGSLGSTIGSGIGSAASGIGSGLASLGSTIGSGIGAGAGAIGSGIATGAGAVGGAIAGGATAAAGGVAAAASAIASVVPWLIALI